MKTTTFIYALIDPITDELRYIGKSNNPQKRFYGHCSSDELGSTSHKNCWIRSLAKVGLRPILHILEEVKWADWEDAERFWIAYFQSIGCRLTNGHGGGLGAHNPTPETRAKLAAAQTGKKFSPEAREKMRAAKLGKKQSPEHIAKVAAKSRGRKHSKETRRKMSESRIGIKLGTAPKPYGKRYYLTSPEGIEYYVDNLMDFCRNHNLTPSGIRFIIKGVCKHHKGWNARLA